MLRLLRRSRSIKKEENECQSDDRAGRQTRRKPAGRGRGGFPARGRLAVSRTSGRPADRPAPCRAALPDGALHLAAARPVAGRGDRPRPAGERRTAGKPASRGAAGLRPLDRSGADRRNTDRGGRRDAAVQGFQTGRSIRPAAQSPGTCTGAGAGAAAFRRRVVGRHRGHRLRAGRHGLLVV